MEDKVEARIEEVMQDLPDVVKEMVNFTVNGGDPYLLLGKLAQNQATGVTKDTDMTQEANQILVMKEALKEQGIDEELIETQIEFYKESGKLEGLASKAFDKLVSKSEAEAKKAAEEQLKQKKALIERQKTFKKDLGAHLAENKEMKGFKFSIKDKRDLPSYIAESNVAMSDGRKVTGLQADLHEALQDKEKTLLLAKLLRSDFDMKDLITKAETAATKKIKDGLKPSGEKETKKSIRTRKKNVADFF